MIYLQYLLKLIILKTIFDEYKRIKDELEPYLGYNGFSFVPWPAFLSFSISEEYLYKNFLIDKDSQIKTKRIDNEKDIKNNLIKKRDNKYKSLYFLNYNSFSFNLWFLFFRFIYYYFYLKKNKYNLNDNIKAILDIGDLFFSLNNNELDKEFWFLVENYNLDKIGITDIYNGYKIEFPISNIFQCLLIIGFFIFKKVNLLVV